MTIKNINFQIIVTFIILIFVIALFQFSEVDILVQSHFFNFETKKWLVDENEPIMKFFFYNGAKNTLAKRRRPSSTGDTGQPARRS